MPAPKTKFEEKKYRHDRGRLANGSGIDITEARREIECANDELFKSEAVLEKACRDIVERGYDFSALQLIDPGEQVIETVCAAGLAKKWEGQAKHYLEKEHALQDIEVDVATSETPKIEIITGIDPRYDDWIVKAYRGERLVSAFVPLLIARDAAGNVLEGEELQEWLDRWDWVEQISDTDPKVGYERKVLCLQLPNQDFQGVSWTIIGTIEAGFEDRKPISKDMAIELAKQAAWIAERVFKTQLEHVFQTVVAHAAQLEGALYASLHFDASGETPVDATGEVLADRIGYVYQVSSGRNKWFLKNHPPRATGLGQRAIDEGRALYDFNLVETNPAVYNEGIRAMFAVPLALDGRRRGGNRREEGVFYVGFGEVPTEDPDQINERIRLFADLAANAIRHATAYTEKHSKLRLFANLHSVAEKLVSEPEDSGLLHHIAGSVHNIFGADVVTIYECRQKDGYVLARPATAGKLRQKGKMRSEIGPDDVPAKFLEQGEDVYSEDLNNSILLDLSRKRPRSKGKPFPIREGVKSAAGICLRFKNEIVGLMFINYRRRHSFSKEERSLIATLASTAAIAIRNRRLLEDYKARDSQIIKGVDLDRILDRLIQEAVKMTGAEFGEIRLVQAPPQHSLVFECKHSKSSKPCVADSVFERIASEARKIRKAVLKNALPNGGTVLSVPAFRDDRVVGVLSVAGSEPWSLHRYQPVLEALAGLMAIALRNAESQDRQTANEMLGMFGYLSGELIHRTRSNMGQIAVLTKKWRKKHPELKDDVAEIENLTAQIRKLGNDLKTFGDEKPRLVDLGKVVQECVARFVPEDMLPKQEGKKNVVTAGPFVYAGRMQLAVVVENLLKNAVQAIDKKRKLQKTVGKISVALSRDGQWIVLRIKDTGNGIKKTDLNRLLTRPWGTTKSRDGSGVGLGFWPAMTYVKSVGGQVWLESTEGKGTLVTVYLPAAAPAAGSEQGNSK